MNLEKVFTGKAISGQKIGRLFGFPTVNLEALAEDVPVEHGVYAGYADGEFPVLLHYGPKPTLNNENVSFEVFFLDFPEGREFIELSVRILGKLRDVQKFDSMEALGEQIRKDREKAMLEYFRD